MIEVYGILLFLLPSFLFWDECLENGYDKDTSDEWREYDGEQERRI